MSAKIKRAIVYARLSISSEESVSIARQVESGEAYAALRGWQVVGSVIDDGVSATHNKPHERAGWSSLLARTDFDVVIIWKIDRLARRVSDFVAAYEALTDRGGSIVAVEQSIDMTSPHGKAMAQIIAVFAELEAAELSARVTAAREHLIRNDRAVGGTVPYGWKSVPNPDGPGKVIVKDADRIDYVKKMISWVMDDNLTIYAVTQRLNETGVPLPSASQGRRKTAEWRYVTVESLLRNPILAGMTAHNPGNRSKKRGADVLRDNIGRPVVRDDLAIITTEQRRALLAKLDGRDSPQARPRASRQATSPLFSGLATCGHCDRPMWRGTTGGRPSLSCPSCHQTISTPRLLEHLESRLLGERGDVAAFTVTVIANDRAHELADIQEAINAAADKLARTDSEEEEIRLMDQLGALKEQRRIVRSEPDAQVRHELTNLTVREEWERASDDEQRRMVMAGQLASLRIVRGKVGRRFDPNRVQVAWRDMAELYADLDLAPDHLKLALGLGAVRTNAMKEDRRKASK